MVKSSGSPKMQTLMAKDKEYRSFGLTDLAVDNATSIFILAFMKTFGGILRKLTETTPESIRFLSQT